MQEEINFVEYWRTLWRAKFLIVLFVGIVSIISVLVTLSMPNIYRAGATLLPVGGPGGFKGAGLGLAAQMGIGGLFGGAMSSSGTQILTVLRSRTLAERMIEKYDLMKVFYKELWDEENHHWKVKSPKEMPHMEGAVGLLGALVFFEENLKSHTIDIRAETIDPKFSADLVNGYIQELMTYLGESTLTVAKRNRIFIEQQLERNKTELLESGKELTQFYAMNRISNVIPNVDVDVTVSQDALAEGLAGPREKGGGEGGGEALPRSAEAPSTDGFPGVSSAYAEVERKAEELQKKADVLAGQVRDARVVPNVPQQVYLQYLALRRELLGQVNTLLTQQYEMAKIEEAKENLDFQVVDWARVPMGKFKPKRRQMVMTSFMLSFFAACFLVFFVDYLKKARAKAAETR